MLYLVGEEITAIITGILFRFINVTQNCRTFS